MVIKEWSLRDCCLVAWIALAACSTGGMSSEKPSSIAQDLAAYGDFKMWDRVNDSYTIPVCFVQKTDYSPTPDWSGDKAKVQTAMTSTWSAYSAVQFQFQGDCPTPSSIPTTWMPIQLEYDSTHPDTQSGDGQSGSGARQPAGVCANGNCEVTLSYGSNYKDFQTFTVHEVGHGLGLRHEFERADFTGCWNTEVNPPTWYAPPPPGTSTGPILTAAVDLESVMSWWECYDTRHHGNNYYTLSTGDQVGVNFLYPISLTRSAGCIGSAVGFHTAGGTVVRSDGSVTTDWTALGAASTIFSTTPNWYVWLSGTQTSIGSGLSLPASTIAAQPHDGVSFSYSDVWGRTHTGRDNVLVDSSLHAALSMTVMAVL